MASEEKKEGLPQLDSPPLPFQRLVELEDPCLTIRLVALKALEDVYAQAMDTETPVGPLKRIARCIVSSVLASYGVYKRWTPAVCAFIKRTCSRELPFAFAPYVAGYITVLDLETLNSSSLLQLLRVAVALQEIVRPVEGDSTGAWIADLVRVEGDILDKLCTARNRINHGAKRRLYSFWHRHMHILPMYSDVWSTAQAMIPLGVLSDFARTHSQDFFVEVLKPRMMDFFLAHILNAKKPPTDALMESFTAFLSSVTQQEFSECFADTITKMSKRSPEGSASAVACFTSNVPVDLSTIVADCLSPVTLRLLKSLKEDVRANGLIIAKHAANKCCDTDAMRVYITSLCNALSGGGLSQWYMRHGVVTALRFCAPGAASVSRTFAAETAVDVTQALISLVDKEGDENTRNQALLGLGDWSALLFEVTGVLKASYIEGIQCKTKSVSTGWLVALVKMIDDEARGKDLLAVFADTSSVALFLKIVVEAMKKPLLGHPDGVLALRLLLELGTLNSTVASSLRENKIFSCLSSSDSFLGSRALMNMQGTDAESSVVLEVQQIVFSSLVACMALVTSNYPKVAVQIFPVLGPDDRVDAVSLIETSTSDCYETSSATTALAGLTAATVIVTALLQASHMTFEACKRWIAIIVNNSPNATPSLTYAFQRLVFASGVDAENARRRALMDAEERNKDKTTEMIAPVSAAKYASVLLRIVDSAPSVKLFPALLLLSAHPFVSGGLTQAQKLWNRMCNLYGGLEQVEALLEDTTVVADIKACILMATFSNSKINAQAATNAMVLLGYHSGTAGESMVVDIVVTALLAQLERPEITKLPDGDVNTFLKDEQGVQTDAPPQSKDAVRVGPQRRMRTGRREQIYDAEDDEWEAQVRAELEAKRKKQQAEEKKQVAKKGAKVSGATKGGKMTAAVSKEPVLTEEDKAQRQKAAMRQRVEFARAQGVAVLEMLSSLANTCPELAHDIIPQAMSIVYPLLRSKLFAQEAFQFVMALSRCISSDILHLAPELTNAIRIASTLLERPLEPKETHQMLLDQASEHAAPVERAVSGLASCAGCFPLDPPSVHFVFPILRAVLSLPQVLPGCEQAFKVMIENYFLPGESILSFETEGVEYKEDEDGPLWEDEYKVLRPLRKQMLDIALKVMTHVKLATNPEQALLRLTEQIPLSPGEWTSLLGVSGLLNESVTVRVACLRSMMVMTLQAMDLTSNPLVESRLWLLCHDIDETCASLANQVWAERGQPLSAQYAQPLLALLQHQHEQVRLAAARALMLGLKQHQTTAQHTIEKLFGVYTACEKPQAEQQDMSDIQRYLAAPIGMEKHETEDTKWPARAAVGLALKSLGEEHPISAEDHVPLIMEALQFIVAKGVVDENECVRSNMLNAGTAIVSGYGGEMKATFIQFVDTVLSQHPSSHEEIRRFDWRREGVVVLLGAAAKHLEPADPRVPPIVQSLIAALSTPSENVQLAVANNLAMLGAAVKAQGPEVLDQLLGRALRGQNYAERRGAAFGVAAVVKGLGIPVLKQNTVIDRLKDALAKGTIGNKQGALFCFETLSGRLGLLFEPYVIVILPLLLESFSDSSDHVRDAAQGAAKVIMQKLSAAGVKQVLNPILKAVPDNNWRTKREAIRLLGTMAYCAPRQLSSCLPQIVPKLCDAFTDPHPKVKDAARTAMQDICSVVRNPEVSRLSPVLLNALTDASKGTKAALEALLECEFMHSIDAPSLAILAPILYRGLRDRTADIKRKAAVITGNMSSMISDSKILIPYLEQLVPGLKSVLVDPIPDVRARAAKALGSLMRGLGESELSDLIPWLIDTLKAESSPVERSGGAQGLAEVLVVIGQNKVSIVLHELLPLKSHPKFNVREGVLWLLCFLPPVLEDDFAVHIPETLPVVLSGLSDEAESVREVAMRSGQVLVSAHGKQHPMLILPTLENGLFDEDWRIRQSSVQLMGDLMYLIGGTKAIGMADETEEDDLAGGSSRAAVAIRSHLGEDRTNGVLASLYIVRSDTSAVVRQSALQVWKTIVSNTPRTLREIMAILVERIVSALASNSLDKRTVAGRALGDLVRKLGDQVLPEVVPFLRQGLERGDEHMRQGVCLGLAEIMSCATKRQIEHFIETLVPAVQEALCDSSVDVREQAAVAFQTLHRVVGARAIDEVVPSLLAILARAKTSGSQELVAPGSIAERALFGLKQVVQLKTRDLLQYLLPRLLHKPISIANALALGSIMEVSGDSVHFYLPQIIPTLIGQVAEAADMVSSGESDTLLRALKHATRQVVKSVETVGVQVLSVQLGQQLGSDDSRYRTWAAWAEEQFFSSTSADFTEQVAIFLRDLLQRLGDTTEAVLVNVNAALQALNAALPIEELVKHLEFARTVITSLISDAKHRKHGTLEREAGEFLLPGLCIARGLEPVLPMFIEGLMHGTPQLREAAATGIGELVEVTSAQALKPFLVKTTGPLIRVVGDKYPSGVKAAILQTLGLLLEKGSAALRPFVPQLQTTFVKALSDPMRQVRQRGCKSLGMLMELSTRVDPLIGELAAGAASADSSAVRATMFEALAQVLEGGGRKAAADAIGRAAQAAAQGLEETDDEARAAASLCMGLAAIHMDDHALLETVDARLLAPVVKQDEWVSAVGRATALEVVLERCGHRLEPLRGEMIGFLHRILADTRPPVRMHACKCLGCFLLGGAVIGQQRVDASVSAGMMNEFAPVLVDAASDASVEVKREALRAIKQVARACPEAVRKHVPQMMPALIAAVKDSNVMVKLVAERAMMYILELRSRPETLNAYVAGADTESARFVRDYSRRVLVRLAADSDDDA